MTRNRPGTVTVAAGPWVGPPPGGMIGMIVGPLARAGASKLTQAQFTDSARGVEGRASDLVTKFHWQHGTPASHDAGPVAAAWYCQ